MFTRHRLQRLIDGAEEEFLRCWDVLWALRSGHPDDRLLSFQTDLAAAIFRLSRAYHELAAESRGLVTRKKELSPRWFVQRQAALARYRDAIDRAITVGRGLGDAFAWFFYQADPELLRQHQTAQHQQFMPKGLGTTGEIEFVRNVKLLADHLVLHHGITSILRIGDVSLIDIRGPRVAGIGELKTSPISEGTLNVQIRYILRGDAEPKRRQTLHTASAAGNNSPQLDPQVLRRLQRQVKEIDTVLRSGPMENSNVITSSDPTHAAELSRSPKVLSQVFQP
jgi:hypothetical protein